jgi:hypothetical protein
MEEKEHTWLNSQNNDNRIDAPEDAMSAQVPSSLLPAVLQRLEISSTPPEIAIDDLAARLKSDDWRARTAAARALERLEGAAPVELLTSMLNDEDEAVRAAAVHVLGNSGSRAPLHALVAALHDPDWHVRETAVYALGKQGRRVPSEILSAALHDADGGVREAAQLVLRWREADTGAPEIYGQLWEQMMTQYNGHDRGQAGPAGNKDGRSSFEYVPYNVGYGPITSNAYAARPNMLREPEQAYATQPEQGAYQLQEYAPRPEGSGEHAGEGAEEQARYAYDESPSRAEKVTSFLPRRESHTKWWIMLLVASAIIFFIMGAGLSMFVSFARVTKMAGPAFQSGSSSSVQKAGPGPVSAYPYPQEYVLWFQQTVASALHLTPEDVRTQLEAGQSMTAIAAAQGISESQLQGIELKAYQVMLSNMVNAGDLNPQIASRLIKQFQNNPGAADNLTMAMFLMDNSNLPNNGSSQPPVPASGQ